MIVILNLTLYIITSDILNTFEKSENIWDL